MRIIFIVPFLLCVGITLSHSEYEVIQYRKNPHLKKNSDSPKSGALSGNQSSRQYMAGNDSEAENSREPNIFKSLSWSTPSKRDPIFRLPQMKDLEEQQKSAKRLLSCLGEGNFVTAIKNAAVGQNVEVFFAKHEYQVTGLKDEEGQKFDILTIVPFIQDCSETQQCIPEEVLVDAFIQKTLGRMVFLNGNRSFASSVNHLSERIIGARTTYNAIEADHCVRKAILGALRNWIRAPL
jgi:hypothetical protein